MNTSPIAKVIAVFENLSDYADAKPHPPTEAGAVPSDSQEEAETPYRYLFESNPHPMWLYDSETLAFLLVNAAAVNHYGYSHDEFLAMTIKDIRPATDVPSLLQSALLNGPHPGKRGTWRHKKKSGDIIEVEITVHDFGFRGRPARLTVASDITERRRIERALQQSEQEQRQLADHLERERERLAEAQAIAKVGSWDLNHTTNMLFWSEQTYRIFGMDPLEFRPTFEAMIAKMHPEDRVETLAAFTAAIENRTAFTIDHRIQMEDGTVKIVHERGRTSYDAAGRPLHSIGTVQDITDRKETEQRLTRSLDLLRAVTEGTTDAIYAKDLQGRYLMINTPGAHFVGKTPEEILGCDDTQLFSPETAAGTMRADRRIIETGETYAQESVGVAADATRVYHSTKGPMRDRNGNVIGVVGISRDITERRRAELTLQHIMEGVHCLLWQAEVTDSGGEDLQWTLQMASEQASQRFLPLHVSPELRYADAWYYARPLEDRERADRYSAAEIRAGRSYQQEFRIRSQDGTLHWLAENVRVETLGEGRWRCTGVSTDITERKLAEEATRAMIRGAQCLLWYASVEDQPHGLQWYIETPDEEAAHQFFPIAQPPGQSYTEALTRSRLQEDSHVMDARGAAALLNGESGYTQQFRCRRKDGEWRWLNETVHIEKMAPGRWHCVGVCTDVTEQKRTEEELEARVVERTAQLTETNARLLTAKQEAEDANRAKSEFLSRMSHELRTPLNAILGFGQILGKQALTPLQEESVQYILKGGRHLLSLINEILDIARVEAGHLELSLEPIGLDEIVLESCALVRPMAAERSISIDISSMTQEQAFVLADRQRLKQVLINLLSNSIKYNHLGGTVRVFCLSHPDARLRIAVQDSGRGISPEAQQKLFTPFERLDAAGSGIEGTGLGLVIARRLVNAMSGHLTLESLPGEGATFFIELPRALPPEKALPEPLPDVCTQEPNRRGEKSATVLAIEDNPSNLRLLEVLLRSRPEISLMAAMQGSVGLDLARQHKPDLILLDLNLPDLSGKEVLARLNASERTRDIPVIVLSADATASQIERLLNAGARAYLTKPLDVTRFLYTLNTLLSDRKEDGRTEGEFIV
jgi:PAS domain S-box-containing protein